MKPRAFAYMAVGNLGEALEALREHGEDAKVIAGGQSLVPMMNMRLVSPGVLIDIGSLSELRTIASDGSSLRIGALARHRDVQDSPLVREQVPLLSKAVALVAHLAVRNRGTFGGSLCHADPSAEFPACALLLDAELEIASSNGQRRVAASDFFQGAFSTALRPDEILVGIQIPVSAFETTFLIDELSRRQGDFAMAGIVASIEGRGNGRTRIVGFGCSDRPIRLPALESLMSANQFVSPNPDELKAATRDDFGSHLDGKDNAFKQTLMQALIMRNFPSSRREAA